MLVLTRKSDQSILIGDDIEIKVIQIKGNGKHPTVRLGVIAPTDRKVLRKEAVEEIIQENRRAADSTSRINPKDDINGII